MNREARPCDIVVARQRLHAAFDVPCRDGERMRLVDAAILSQFGVNLLRLPPGSWSSQRHWQIASDEFVYVVNVQVVLMTDAGEETMRAGAPPASRQAPPTGTTYGTAARRNTVPRGRHAAGRRRVATTRTST